MLFHAVMKICLDLSRSKFWLIGDWSIGFALHIISINQFIFIINKPFHFLLTLIFNILNPTEWIVA
jgi:hypothetical protein